MPAAGELLPQDKAALRGAKLFPAPWRKVSEIQFPDFCPDQPQGRVTDDGRHFSDLTIFSFREFQTDPTVGDVFTEPDRGIPRRQGRLRIQKPSPAGKGGSSFDDDTLRKLLQTVCSRYALDLGPVGAGVALFRIQQPAVQARFIAEEKKSLGVRIQPADGIDVFGKAELGEGSVRGSVRRELGKDAVGLMEGEKHEEVPFKTKKTMPRG